jgi:hypothetical protein
MEYRIQSTGEVLTQGQIRKLNSNTSLPRVWDANVCAALGIDPVLAAPKPEVTGYTQAVRNGATQDANGNWVQAWSVVDMFQDTTDDDGVTTTKAEHEAAYQADLDAKAAESIRTQRDKLLAESDWVTVKAVDQNAADSLGIQVPQVWLDYRQALRDITNHADFPHITDEAWPTAPEA